MKVAAFLHDEGFALTERCPQNLGCTLKFSPKKIGTSECTENKKVICYAFNVQVARILSNNCAFI